MPSMQHSPESREPASEVPAPTSSGSGSVLAWLLTLGGGVGLVAAAVLTVEKIRTISDPAYIPSCDLNPIVSCGSVMVSDQASVFGFPNSLLGVAGFAVVAAVGAALLAGASFDRWFWIGLQVGVTLGVLFVHWLIIQSLWQIGALCPYCMVVWIVTVPTFWYVTLRNVRTWVAPGTRWVRVLTAFHAVPLTLWFSALATAIVVRFWDFWVSQI